MLVALGVPIAGRGKRIGDPRFGHAHGANQDDVSQLAQVVVGQAQAGNALWLVANTKVCDFRACALRFDWQPGEPLQLDAATAQALRVAEGDSLRLIRGD